jgi:hypothetical protein
VSVAWAAILKFISAKTKTGLKALFLLTG